MRSFKKVCLVIVSLLVAFQLTAGLGLAKSAPRIIPVENTVVSSVSMVTGYVEDPSTGYYKLNLSIEAKVVSEKHPELSSGTNYITATIVGNTKAIEAVMWGGYIFVVDGGHGVWEGTWTGYTVKGAEPNTTRNEIFATGKGSGDLNGYIESIHETQLFGPSGPVSDTAVGWVYIPAK